MTAAEESAVCGKGAGVCRGKDQMVRIGEQGPLRLGVGAPEEEDHGLTSHVKKADHLIGKGFPALSPVGVGAAPAHGEHRI